MLVGRGLVRDDSDDCSHFFWREPVVTLTDLCLSGIKRIVSSSRTGACTALVPHMISRAVHLLG